MRVKVGDRWIDSTLEPVAVELNDGEREAIYRLPSGVRRYAQAPEDLRPSDFASWLEADTGVAE